MTIPAASDRRGATNPGSLVSLDARNGTGQISPTFQPAPTTAQKGNQPAMDQTARAERAEAERDEARAQLADLLAKAVVLPDNFEECMAAFLCGARPQIERRLYEQVARLLHEHIRECWSASEYEPNTAGEGGDKLGEAHHPALIDLDTGDEYEWRGDGYAHEGDADFAWPRAELEKEHRLAEVDSLDPGQLAALRAKYEAGDADTCACGTTLDVCPCGFPRCYRCDPAGTSEGDSCPAPSEEPGETR